MFSFLSDDFISLNRYIFNMLNSIAHTYEAVQQPIVIILVAIALIALVGGFILISNYVMPNVHQYCQNKQGALHCYQVQYHKIF
jgi:ABC-type antimicrobial peptide transport system permease subunit